MNKSRITTIFKNKILPDLYFWYEMDVALDLPRRKTEWKTLNNTHNVDFQFPKEFESIIPSREEIDVISRGISENVAQFVKDLP